MTEDGGWCGASVAAHAARRPAAPAILTADEEVGWATFHARVEAMAAALHGGGVCPGAPAALLMRDGAVHLVATFALHRLGVPLLVLDPDDPAALNVVLAARAAAELTIGAAADAAAAPGHFLAFDECPAGDAALPPPPAPEAICLFARSSGTTGGIPKLAAISHRQQIARTLAAQHAMPLGTGDRYFALVSNGFSYGRNSTYRALVTGGAVIFQPPLRSVAGLVAAMRAGGTTWTAVTPHHLRRLLEAAGTEPLLPDVRLLCSTAALTPDERRSVMRRVSPQLFVMYGTNESGILAFAAPPDIRRHPGTVGRPPPGMRAFAVDDDGRPLPAGEVGRLRFADGPFPAGYLGATDGGSSRFAPGWFEPGDIGLVDADGYVFLKGRIDDVVNVGGRKILPADIEVCLRTHPAVVDAVVVALRDRRLGERAVAVAQARAAIAPATLVAFCRARLGPGRAPQAVLVVDAIPVTALGKPDRRAVAALAVARLAAPGDGAPGDGAP
ncbi:MAG: long-chain fatty acid--CoA ligase [Alphaproteobacteria bacterium]|nr:long-chain fatty acid--CoA ligase [Alphaproteobacteria bacterium]